MTPSAQARGRSAANPGAPIRRGGLALGALLSLLLAACSALPRAPADGSSAYATAIADAAVASPRKVLPLLAVPEGETLSVVAWLSERKIPDCTRAAVPCEFKLGERPLWVTLAGELQARCRTWNLKGDALRRRIEQLLGLPMDPPPAYRGVAFVEFRVARASVERPCLGIAADDAQRPVCTLTASPTTPAPLRNFVAQQMADSYVVDNPQGPGYPYTRLGYTYDWAPTADAGHYGASEFIVAAASPLTAVALFSADDYCRPR